MTISVAIAGATGYVDAEFLAEVTHKGDYLRQEVEKLQLVERVRGRGLMLGIVLAEPVAKQAVRDGLARGLILNAPSENVLRLTPPLVISHDELDADNGNTGSEPRGMTHFLTGHDLLMCLQRDLSSMLVPTLYRNLVNPPMTL